MKQKDSALYAVPLLITLIVAACVSSTPAPVETRAALPATGVPSVTPVARPGYYIVKKGDTLYSIALENGHDYRDVASWNGISNPSLISVGQELRVQPPDGASASASASSSSVPAGVTQPVPPVRIESRPADQSAPVVAKPQDNVMVSEPRGGRIPFSDKAWRDLQGQSVPVAAASAPAADKPQAKPPVVAAASAPVAEPAKGDEKTEWGWPSNGRVIAGFNDSTNKGLDFGGAIGDPVYAAAAGKVIYVGSDLRGYGNLVIIKHGAQLTTVYAHNKEILVKEQQMVQKGQKIAVMGDSDAERPKLHFELRIQGGKPVDPTRYLPTR